MMDVFFLLLFTCTFVFAVLVGRASGFNFFKVGIVQFVIVLLLVKFIGVFPLYYKLDEYRVAFGVVNKELILYMTLATSYSIMAFLAGAIILKMAYGYKRLKFTRDDHNIIIGKYEFSVASVGFIVVFFILLHYLSKVPAVALIVAIMGNVSEGAVARSMMGNDFEGSYHWYSLFMHDVSSMLCFGAFAAYLLSSRKTYFFLFVILFIYCAFTATMAIEKAPFVWLLVGLYIVYSLCRNKGEYSKKYLSIMIALIFLVIALFYIAFMGTESIGEALLRVFSRAFGGSMQPAYHYLEIFPGKIDFLHGRTFPNPGGLMPFLPFSLSKEVMNIVNPSGIEGGVVGSMPTVFWGEAYANFGLLGILFVPFVMGMLVCTIDLFLTRFKNSPLKIGFYVTLMLHYSNLSSTGFAGYIIDISAVTLFCIATLLIFISNGFKFKINKDVCFERS